MTFQSAVCTLFEGHYHHGLAALTNSLYKQGFKGHIYAGYRGELPIWAEANEQNHHLNWDGAKTLTCSSNFFLHFLPVNSNAHFTNYKPEFVLTVWEKCILTNETPGIFYFDPDIVNKCNWDFYERWIKNGVALVHEIVWNDMPPFHPKRNQWAAVADLMGYPVRNMMYSYINAGFIGVSKDQIAFLRLWKRFIDFSEASFKFNTSNFSQNIDNSELFTVGDQDLLNLTAMCTEEKLSEFGPEGMDFTGGGWLMSHATGSPKPWKTNYLYDWLIKGKRPAIQSKEYWKNSNGIIKSHSKSKIRFYKLTLKAASFLSRFYRR